MNRRSVSGGPEARRVFDVTLVNAPLARKRSDWIAPPLGLLYVAAALEEAGISVKVVDANVAAAIDEVTAYTAEGGVVGFSSFTPNYPRAAQMALDVRRLRPDVTTVLGGFHATFAWRQVLAEGAFDAVVRGAGEPAMPALVRAIQAGRRDSLEGVVWKEEGQGSAPAAGAFEASSSQPPPPLQVIDFVARPARHLLDWAPYKASGASFAGSVQHSRGCRYSCCFCQVRSMEGGWRARDPEDTAREVAEAKRDTGVNHFVFIDNLLTGDKTSVLALCGALRRLAPGITWACDARVDKLDRDLVREMRAAGCRSIFAGLESGDEATLRAIGKTPDLENVKARLQMVDDEGIKIVGSFVIGFPWEDEDAIRRTIAFARAAPLAVAEFSFATPLPGTRLAAEARSHGAYVLVTDVARWDGQTPVMVLPHISRRRLVELYLEAIGAVYTHGTGGVRQEAISP